MGEVENIKRIMELSGTSVTTAFDSKCNSYVLLYDERGCFVNAITIICISYTEHQKNLFILILPCEFYTHLTTDGYSIASTV